MARFVRISALIWADLLAAFAMYVMINYLTDVWNLSTTHAAGIINIWNGITPALAIIFAFFVDAFVGDLYMLVFSSIAYSIGLGLLSMSTPPVFGPCKDYKEECVGHTQKVLFFTALPLIAVGMAGHLVSLSPFLDLQITTKKEKKKEKEKARENENEKKDATKTENEEKILWQIPGLIMVVVVLITGGIALPYIKPWSVRFGIPAICSVVATLMFSTGFRKYETIEPMGSPLTTTLRVFVVTARNISQPIPNPKNLYRDKENKTRLTSSLRWLEKAAINLPEEQEWQKWKVCSVREVEETKIGIRILPMWLTFIVIGIVLSIGNTYFLEQAKNMDKKLGKIEVTIPIFLLFYSSTSSIFAYFYSYFTTLSKKYAPPIGIATGMVFSVLCCITAAKVENRRLNRIRDHGLLDKPDGKIPMSIFALLPQFMLLAAVDGISINSITGFFRHQTPESMHKYLTYFTKGVIGLGNAASVLSVYVVGKVSERNQKPNWFQDTLNMSRLDRYYWVLASLSSVNLIVYLIVAYFYKYKESPDDDDAADENEAEVEGGQMEEGFEDKKCCC